MAETNNANPNRTRRTLREKVNRGLALVGIASVAGGALAENALARTAETRPPSPNAIKALLSVHQRWNGVIVITAPKKGAESVGFTTEPGGNETTDSLGSTYEIPHGSTESIGMFQPGMLKWKDGKTYLVGYTDNTDPELGFLDYAAARKAGELHALAFKDSAPRSEPYSFATEIVAAKGMPRIHLLDTAASDLKNLVWAFQPYTYDPATHKPGQPATRDLVPSKVLPRLK